MEPAETIHVDNEVLSCDGGDGPLGHPRVFLSMEGKGQIDCPYCGCRFVLRQAEVVQAIVSDEAVVSEEAAE